MISSAQPLADQLLSTNQRINGEHVYITLKQEILRISISMPCPDCSQMGGGAEKTHAILISFSKGQDEHPGNGALGFTFILCPVLDGFILCICWLVGLP